MTTKQSRDLLDWFRSYASSKFTAIGYTADASNMNVPLTNDTRVQSAINYLTAREAELWASWSEVIDPFWDSAVVEVRAEIEAQMPANVRDLWVNLYADPDLNARRLVKALMRVLCMAVQAVRAGAG